MADPVATFQPGTQEYRSATSPHNSITPQRPAAVARPTSAADVAGIVTGAAQAGLTVVPQATGHGAGAEVDDHALLVDTSGMNAVAIDPERQTATVGAGATWQEVNQHAFAHGLLGRAGSSPSVAVSGYSFGGGIGWLVRPHGLQSAVLRRVDYVDGSGTRRTAADDAPDALDREAMYAFRGGGGVGVATELEFTLVRITDLYAGFLLWSGEHLQAVVQAWADTIDRVGDAVGTSISLLRLPPLPDFPADLQNTQVVHLALAATDGGDGARPLLDAVRRAAAPQVDTWGPADADRLGGIHLDPPPGVPAVGRARWLSSHGASVAAATLATALDSPVAMVEIRSVGQATSDHPGAEVEPPGPFLVHAVGAPSKETSRRQLDEALDVVIDAASAADLGLSAGSWVEGAAAVPDALPADVRARVIRTARAVDPHDVIARSRYTREP